MTDAQMTEFVDKIRNGKGSSRANSRQLSAFNTEIMKQAEAYAEKARIKPIATDNASVMRRGQTLVRNSSRYVAIAAVASVSSFLTDSAKALDVMAESDHFKEAIRQAQRGNLMGTHDALTASENADVDGNNLLSDLVNKGGLDRRAAFLLKTQVDEYFARIVQKRNAIDALRE